MRPTQTYAPDGMTHAGLDSATQRQLAGFSLADCVQAHERHDCGLVHGHHWATSDARHEVQAVQSDWVPARVQPARSVTALDDAYDDGLVHNHRWAMTEE